MPEITVVSQRNEHGEYFILVGLGQSISERISDYLSAGPLVMVRGRPFLSLVQKINKQPALVVVYSCRLNLTPDDGPRYYYERTVARD